MLSKPAGNAAVLNQFPHCIRDWTRNQRTGLINLVESLLNLQSYRPLS